MEDVEPQDSELRVGVKSNIVGQKFRLLLARKVAYIMECLYYFLKLDLQGETQVIEAKFGDRVSKEGEQASGFFLGNEKGFFELTGKIFSAANGEEETQSVVDDLGCKLELLYKNFAELKVFYSGSKTPCFGLSDEHVLQEYSEYHAEMTKNSSFLSQVGTKLTNLQPIYYHIN